MHQEQPIGRIRVYHSLEPIELHSVIAMHSNAECSRHNRKIARDAGNIVNQQNG